jgi:hypothetical protein
MQRIISVRVDLSVMPYWDPEFCEEAVEEPVNPPSKKSTMNPIVGWLKRSGMSVKGAVWFLVVWAILGAWYLFASR